MPFEAPVTSTTLPVKSVICLVASCWDFVYNTYTNSSGRSRNGRFKPSLDGERTPRREAGDAEGDRRAHDRGVVRADPARPSPEEAVEVARGHPLRGAVAPAPDRHDGAE